MPSTPTATLVAKFAQRFDATYLHSHGVTSPLGLWLIYALLAPFAQDDDRAVLEQLLGTDARDATARANALLSYTHPGVEAVLALWAEQEAQGPQFSQLTNQLADHVAIGSTPTQEAADDWTRTQTRGLISQFPTRLADSLITLVSLLVSDIKWRTPYDRADSANLGGDFGPRVDHVLMARSNDGQFLASTEAAGDVAVHWANAQELDVVSVLARPEVPPAQVLQAAHEIITRLGDPTLRIHPFHLPLGLDDCWEISEYTARKPGPAEQVAFKTYLPAWSARSSHDLTNYPGMDQAFSGLAAFLEETTGPATPTAVQSARAMFTADGFRAAAVTSTLLLRQSSSRVQDVVTRETILRFNRPYAAVAAACPQAETYHTPWSSVPVFSVWVAEPIEAVAPPEDED
jgi:hypothetical protein